MQKKPTVSACIVTYQCYDKCREAVKTMLECTKEVALTVYIVDNASQDDTLSRLKEEFPSIVTIQNPDNKGFGHGHNTVLPLLKSDYHAIINPDITFDHDTISDLCAVLEQEPDIGVITPEIRYPNGDIQIIGKRNPSFLALFGRHMFQKQLEGVVQHYQMLDEDLSKPIDIEFATGCFMLMRTEIFKQIGGFDERFFMYFEDMDITRRALKIKRAVYYPYTYIYHAWERSSSHHIKYFIILVFGMFKYFGKWGFKLK